MREMFCLWLLVTRFRGGSQKAILHSLRPLRTWFGGEVAHQAREERVDGSQDLGVSTRHAGRYPSLKWFEAAQNHRRLEDGEQETENFQSGADVGKVGLVGLLLEQKVGVKKKI